MRRQTVSAEAIDTAITTTETTRVSLWRARAIAFLRIAFGLIWAIDAWFKQHDVVRMERAIVEADAGYRCRCTCQ